MKLVWAAEVNQQLNGCRLFFNRDFAEATIIKEMNEEGYMLFSKEWDDEGRDSFLLRFIRESEKSKIEYLSWIFCWIEVEEE